MEINELVSLADQVLAQPSPSDAGLDVLETYINAFDEWFAANEQLIRAQDPAIDRNSLHTLLQRHEAVLEMAEKAQAQYPEDLRKLRQRGKGLMAYTDILPKKISYKKPKEG